MLQYNLLKWCDDKITMLKENKISFKNGIPQLPSEFVYFDYPKAVSTFRYRNDIPDEFKKESVLTFYMYEENLWPRLSKIDKDIDIIREYGGIAGFDLSPSVEMLRPRQRLSILVNAIHACYCGLNGVLILPNYRAGDLGTLCAADYFADNSPFIIGALGCANNGYKEYGNYQLDILLKKKHPPVLYVYGSISKKEAEHLITKNNFEIITFPDRRNRIRNDNKSYKYSIFSGKVIKSVYADLAKRGVA